MKIALRIGLLCGGVLLGFVLLSSNPQTEPVALTRGADSPAPAAERPALAKVTAPVFHSSAVPAAPSVVVRVEPQQVSPVLASVRERLGASSLELRRISVPTRLAEAMEVTIGEGATSEVMQLQRHSVRSPNFKVLVPDEDGGFIQVPSGPVRTYVGGVVGDSDSFVAMSIRSDGLRGRILSPESGDRRIAPLSAAEAAALAGAVAGDSPLHAVYVLSSDQQMDCSDPTQCGEPLIAALGENGEMEPAEKEGSPILQSLTGQSNHVEQAEIGIDVAFSFYSDWGGSNTGTTVGVIEDWVNDTLNATFVPSALVVHELGTIVIRTSSGTDPYNGMGDAYAILPFFRDIWNGNNATWPSPSSTHDLAQLALDQSVGVTGLAYVGTVGTSSRYGLTTSSSGFGYWTSGARHEVGHTWSLSHGDGSGELTHWYDGFGIMTGGFHDRLNTVEADKIIQHRNSRSPSVLDDLIPYAVNRSPYCRKDWSFSANASGPTVSLDVLANDHDANNDDFYIEWIKVNGTSVSQHPTPAAIATPMGGSFIRSIATGPNGRDQILYTPPVTATGATEDCHYGAREYFGGNPSNTGGGGWGHVRVNLGEGPPPPFGEVETTCILADTLYDWNPSVPRSYGWFYGFYSAGTTFVELAETNIFAQTWIGGDARVWRPAGGTSAPRIGQYAQEPGSAMPAVRRWVSAFTGEVAIEYDTHRLQSTGGGAEVSIRHNGTLLMSHTLDHNGGASTDDDALHRSGTVFAQVTAGDTIDFVVSALGDNTGDWVSLQGRIVDRACVLDDAARLVHMTMDTGSEMAAGEGADYDRRGWAADGSGNDHHAQLNNAETQFVWKPGVRGQCFHADGANDYLEVEDSGVGDGATELTVAVWIKPDVQGGYRGIISAKKDGVTQQYFSLTSTGFTNNAVEWRALNAKVVTQANSIQNGKWTHVVGVWKSGETLALYLDGVQAPTSFAATAPTGAMDIDLWQIGTDRLIANRYFDGAIDDVGIWSRALAPGEVQALFEQGSPGRDYNGSSDHQVISETQVSTNFTEVTLAAWFKPDSKGDNKGIVSTEINDPSESYFALLLSGTAGAGNPAEFRALGNKLDGPNNSAPVGTWVHAVGVWKAGEIQKLYVDGSLSGEIPQASVPSAPANLNGWVVGRDRDGPWSNRNFDGQIGEVLILERALNEDEVLELYQRGRNRYDAGHARLLGFDPVGFRVVPGPLREASGVYSLSSGSLGVFDGGDSLQFSKINGAVGEGECWIRLDAIENLTSTSMSGLMVRESLAGNAPFVMAVRRADNALALLQRDVVAGTVNAVTPWTAGPAGPIWLRLLRFGDGVAARYSSDGVSWSSLGFTVSTLPTTAPAGVAVMSGSEEMATAAIGDLGLGALTDDDIDDDLLIDAWEMLYLSSLGSSSGGTNDFDGDGSTDIHEQGAGTLPQDPLSYFGLFSEPEPVAGGLLRLTWYAVTGKTYRVLSADDLSIPMWDEEATGIPGVVPTTYQDVTPSAVSDEVFYKIEVENPGP